MTFGLEEAQVAFENRSIADAVQVRFVASQNDQKKEERKITRTRATSEAVAGGGSAGVLEAVLELLNVHPQLPVEAPPTARLTLAGWRILTRTKR